MRKKSPNKIILLIGLAVVAATPFSIILFTPALAIKLCVNQNLEDTVYCTPNDIKAFLITLFTPLLVGSALIVISVLARKSSV